EKSMFGFSKKLKRNRRKGTQLGTRVWLWLWLPKMPSGKTDRPEAAEMAGRREAVGGGFRKAEERGTRKRGPGRGVWRVEGDLAGGFGRERAPRAGFWNGRAVQPARR